MNTAAFAIHSALHEARPDVIAAAHSHSIYGKAWSSLGRLLDPLTQDACAFYDDHALFDDYTGVVLDPRRASASRTRSATRKAVILRNHGLLTVGHSVDEAVWWFVTMERSCQAQLLAEAAGTPVLIDDDDGRGSRSSQVGAHVSGYVSFQPLYAEDRPRAARPASTDRISSLASDSARAASSRAVSTRAVAPPGELERRSRRTPSPSRAGA